MTVRVVVPCFNEVDRFDPVAFVELADQVDEIVFVDDGSTDDTGDVIEQFCRDACADLIRLPNNAGKAEAVRVGMLEAIERGSTIVGYLDADLATPVGEMLRLVEAAQRDPSRAAVIGSRVALLGHSVHRRPTRHYLGRLYATAASLALGVPVYDTQCGAKVFRVAPPLRAALAEPFHDRWSFDVELLARLLSHPALGSEPVVEMPLQQWHDVPGSSVGLVSGARASAALFGLRRRVRRHSLRRVSGDGGESHR